MPAKTLRKLCGLPVVDAVKPLKVTVTKYDIQHATRKNGDTCAAAMALCRQDKVEDAFVYMSRAYVRYANRWVRYVVSQKLRDAIIKFDTKGGFPEGTYTLHPAPPTSRLGSDYHTEYCRMRASKPTGRVHRAHDTVEGVRERCPRIVGEAELR